MTKKQPQKNNIMVIVCCVFLLIAVNGCSKQDQAPVLQVQPKAASNSSAKPVQKQVSSALKLTQPAVNQFDFSSKKDPFKPYVMVKVPITSKEEQSKVRNDSLPIHSYDVNQFKLIGIIVSGRVSQAMLTDPAGKGYVVRVGMTIGKNDGKITSISNNSIDVVEQFKDDNGRLHKESIKITLPKKQ